MTTWLSENLPLGASLLAAFIHLSGVLSALHAAVRTRSAQGAVAWSISLITVPYLALPLYWVFGRGKFHGYVAARRSGDLEIHHVAAALRERLERYHQAALPADCVHLQVFQRLAGMPFSRGNAVELLRNGEAAYSAIFAAIDAAQDYVIVQAYMLRDDDLGRDLRARLVRRAQSGVWVHLLYDEIGSYGLSKAFFAPLRTAGALVNRFGTTRGPVNRFQLNFRNHRKIVVVDGREAFVGGLNFGDEYLGRNLALAPWRDTHLKISGPVVQAIQLAFVEDWFWAAREVPLLDWETRTADSHDMAVLALPTGPADPQENCELFFLEAIRSARRRIWIASPYFVPDESVVGALQLAGLRGVDVRILIPANPDHLLVYLAAFSYFDDAGRTGVKFFRYTDGFLHEKVMLIDDGVATIGTANFDNRSFRLNFEITAVIADEAFAAEVERMFEADFAKSKLLGEGEYSNRSFWFRLSVRLARLTSPLL